jgi:hypothetical protein
VHPFQIRGVGNDGHYAATGGEGAKGKIGDLGGEIAGRCRGPHESFRFGDRFGPVVSIPDARIALGNRLRRWGAVRFDV